MGQRRQRQWRHGLVSAATQDGHLLVACVPDAHTGSFGVAMSALSDSVRARWFDSSTGIDTAIGTFANSGVQGFTPPATNGSGELEWVLVLDVSDSDIVFDDGYEL